MQKYISIIVFSLSVIISHHIKAQNKKIQVKDAEYVINNYLKNIGGIKKLEQVKTLHKKFNTELNEVSDLKIQGEVVFSNPNLYYSIVSREIANLKQIHETKYNGKTCIMSQVYNNEKSKTIIKGAALESKMQDFYPFPILTQKSKNTKFKLIKTIEKKDYKYFKILNENPLNKDSVFLYFDSKKYFLRKKEIVSPHNTTIIEYYDFNEEEGIIFPFKEMSTLIIDGKEAQSSTTIINSIIINSTINRDLFQ